jgi:periplasmic protein TonB
MKGLFILFFIPCFCSAQGDSGKLPPPPGKSNTAKGWVKIEREANFPGGDSAFQQFLKVNLQGIQDSAISRKTKKSVYQIELMFVVGTDGIVKAVRLESKPKEKFLEKAVSDLIERSPKWEPAIMNGKEIRSIRRQPLTIEIDY